MKNQTIKRVEIIVGKSQDGQLFGLTAYLMGIEDQGNLLVTGLADMDQCDIPVQSFVPDFLAGREGFPHATLEEGLEYVLDLMAKHGGIPVKKHVFMTGYTSEEFGYGPAFGMLTVDASLVVRGIELTAAVRAHKVRAIHVEADKGLFTFDDGDRDFILEDQQMVVNRQGLSFQANVRVLEEQAYCDSVPMLTLIDVLSSDYDVIFDPVSVDPDSDIYLQNVVAKAMARRLIGLDVPEDLESLNLASGENPVTSIQACLKVLNAHQPRAQ